MRNFISVSLTIVVLLFATLVNAQGYTFRVLANKGDNKVKKAGSGTAVALKTGATLNANDILISSSDAYIGLMHKTGKTTEIRGSGTKKVSDIEKQVNVASTSVANRYAQFVMNKLNEEENTNYRARQYATGAVSRATGSAAINVLAPEQVEVLEDKTVVRWNAPEGMEEGETYTVKVRNIFDEVIYETETEKTSVELDFTAESMQNDAGLYLVKVYKTSDEEIASGEVGIKKVKENDKVEVQESLAALKQEVSEDSPLNKLIFASFYEENGLILDALTKYEEAIKMSPDVDDFQELYQNFLINNGLAQ
ncbi:hypothetical protein [Marinoscillum sp. MHG1-6]|uniref:hypothetical protein n=1 Tax=Marinoscillum sp. MHG1-6 TaxID=2959627 RepID=UPI002158257F|nr:hypothetical protein [Marinoscillum sp. MHG1-6]